MRKIQHVVQCLSDFDDVRDIWLFGSYVTDQYMHSSDVDLCIIVSDDSELQYVDIAEYVGKLKLGLPFEFHIYREGIFKQLLKNGTGFVNREIIKKGKHLHSKD